MIIETLTLQEYVLMTAYIKIIRPVYNLQGELLFKDTSII